MYLREQQGGQISEGSSIAWEKKTVSTFRSYLKCCGIIREGSRMWAVARKERFESSKGVKVLCQMGVMVWEQQ